MRPINTDGIIPPLITPFTRNGGVYEDGLKRLIEFQIENGVKGLFICGTYGSGPLMPVEQRKEVAESIVGQVNGRIPVIVHCGTSSADMTIELAKHAEDVGADAVSSVPLFYYSFKEEAVEEFYRQLISSVNLPVFAYNNPARTGFSISANFLNKLANIGLAGVKDSSYSLSLFYEYLNTVEKEDFIFIEGTEALLFPAVAAGAKGCISGLANIFPEPNVEAYEAVRKRLWDKAVELQLTLIRLRTAIHTVETVPCCHAVLKMRGIDVGVPKKPLRPLTEKESVTVKAALEKAGYL